MEIGITTRSFRGMTNAAAARAMRELGFTCTELCLSQTDSDYWVYNGRSDLSDLSAARFRQIADTYRAAGISVEALGVFTNLLEPDDSILEQNLAYFRHHMELAAEAGIRILPTECGFIPDDRGVRLQHYESRFDRLKYSLSHLCETAQTYDVFIALEPCVLDVVPSAKRMADLIAQIGSDRLRVLLDPANLIANSSEEDMFRYLSPRIAYFHGKDRRVNDARGRVVGDGDINWPLFLSLYHRHNEGAPFILEYADANNAGEIFRRVQEYDRAAVAL